jgi:hypothetical protein
VDELSQGENMLARLRTALPVHPTLTHPDGSPVTALGISHRTGRLIWPVRGAAPDDGDSDDQDDDADSDDDPDDKDDAAGAGDDKDDDDKPLGPKGEKALEAEKTKRRAAQAQLREWKALGLTAAEVSKRLAALPKDGGKDDEAPDADAIRAEIKAEVDAERQRERVLDKIEAKAARLFADPDDAAALLLRGKDVNDFLDDDGKIDIEEIEDGLKSLLEKKPYLAAQGGKRFKGGGDGGARKEQKPKAANLQDAVAARIAAGKT